ncbi:MAG: glycosyltransferase family 2 protein [Romboutsia sp.]
MLSKVSIIIPVYNCEKYIGKCLDSILNQSYIGYEVIVIDDGSTDDTLNIIKKYSISNENIKYFSQKNSGPSTARNYGIEVSKSEYLVFIDADDTIQEKYLEILLEKIIYLNVDIVACGYIDISKYGIYKLNDFYANEEVIQREKFTDCIFLGTGGTLWGKIFKREIVEKYKLRLNPDIFMCEDMLFLLEYTMKCSKYGVIKENIYRYNRLNDNSISSKTNFNYYNKLILVVERIEKILKENNFSNDYIDKIITNRIMNLSISLIIMQHKYKHSNRIKVNNLRIIFSNIYFIRYEHNFIQNDIKNKILIKLMKYRCYMSLNIYSLSLYKIQKLKDMVRGIG